MTITKCSARTIRQGCPACGRKDLHRGHDTAVWTATCDKCQGYGEALLIERDATPHILTCAGTTTTTTTTTTTGATMSDTTTTTDDTTTDDTTTDDTTTAKRDRNDTTLTATTATANQAAKVQALADALAGMTPTVDRADVVQIVKDELAGVIFPTTTCVKRDGITHTVPGLSHFVLADLIDALLSGEHVYLVGPAGTGKSHMAAQAAEAIGVKYHGAISVNAMTADSDLMGFFVPGTGAYQGTPNRNAFQHGGVFCVDEIDKGHPGVVSVLNSMTSNGSAGFPDGLVFRHDDHRVIATGNTYGTGPDRLYVGSQQLDAATLTRFTQIEVPIDPALERALCLGTGVDASRADKVISVVNALRANIDSHRLSICLSPRTTVGACRLLNQGVTASKVVASRIRCGITDTDWAKVSDGVRVGF